MTLKELRDNVLRLLWLEQLATVPPYIYADVTTAINSGLQLMFQSPLDYFRKEELTINLNAAESTYNFGETITEVIGPVWIPAENRELHQIKDEMEFNQLFERFYGMSEADAIADGVSPASYYFIRTRRSFSEDGGADNSSVQLAIKPPTTDATEIKVLVATKPESYSTDTITNLTGTEPVPAPSSLVETTLLPLCRWYAMRSHFFFEKDKIELINADAQRAMVSLQVSDPEMGTKSHMAEQLRKQQKQQPTS